MNILFFHGFDGSPADLAGSIRALEQAGHRVVAPELKSCRLHGGRFAHPADWIREASDIFSGFATGSVAEFGIAGHSLGGAICAHLLTSPRLSRDTANVLGCAFLATAAGIDEKFLQFWKATSSRLINWPFELQAGMFSFLRETDSRYAKIKTPSMVLLGDQDEHIPPASGTHLCRFLGKYCVELAHHPGCNHFFPLENAGPAGELNRRLATFFSDLDNDSKR